MQFGERNWMEAGAAEHQKKVVVLPLGSLEQHGHHLPLLTDTMIGSEIARRAEAELGDSALFLPMLWIGASDHHRAFPGTVSVSNDVYVKVLIDLLESLIGGGFRRIFLLNAHGGNITPGRMAIYDVQLRHYQDKPDLWLAFSSWWAIAAPQIAAIEGIEAEAVTHACEMETSMILRLRPELVRPNPEGANVAFDSAFYCPDFSQPSRVDVPRAFNQISRTGAFGHPEVASVEKGEALFSAAVQEVVTFVREFATWEPFAPQ